MLDKRNLTYMMYGAAGGAAMYLLLSSFSASSPAAPANGGKPSTSNTNAEVKQEKKTLYERLGGSAAIEAAVDKFYVKVLADPRVNKWFAKTNMAHQHRQQKKFLIGALGGPSEYTGRPMDAAHARLVRDGLGDAEFNAIAENLQNTLLEMGVPKDLVGEVIGAVATLRDQILCRGQFAAALSKAKDSAPKELPASLFERLGGAPALDAAVDRFYVKVLADPRVNRWFARTNMAHQHRQQKKFLTAALGGPNEYTGRPMDAAHARLVRDGLGDADFNAIAENLQNTLLEMGVNKDLVNEVITAAASLRDQILCRGEYSAALRRV